MWSNSNRYRSGSNVTTDNNQGGGDKKAGLPNSVGMNTAWDNVFLNRTSQNLIMLVRPISTVRPSRPVGTRPAANYPAFNMF